MKKQTMSMLDIFVLISSHNACLGTCRYTHVCMIPRCPNTQINSVTLVCITVTSLGSLFPPKKTERERKKIFVLCTTICMYSCPSLICMCSIFDIIQWIRFYKFRQCFVQLRNNIFWIVPLEWRFIVNLDLILGLLTILW